MSTSTVLVLPNIAGVCIDCRRRTNVIQQGRWLGFCYSCATDARVVLAELELEDAADGS